MDKIELPLLKGKNQEKYIPYTLIIGVVVLFILLLITSLSLTFKTTYKLHYTDSSDLDYKVYLKDNDYYRTSYLGKDKQYISSLIDYVKADFSYTFSSDDDIDIDYSYYILANLEITNTDGKIIFDKQDYLLNKKIDESNRNLNVMETVKIDYQKYNSLAKEFIDKYGITCNANLIVSLNVNVKGSKNEFDRQINENGVIKLIIPLTNKTVDITMDYNLSNNKDAILQYGKPIIKNKYLFVISIVLIALELISIVAVIVYIISKRDKHALYHARLSKILREYERYISETVITERVEDMLKTQSLRIEIIKSFDDLMDIRDSLNKPILYHEERSGLEAVFYILSEKVGYIYVMKVDDFKKDNKNTKTKKK